MSTVVSSSAVRSGPTRPLSIMPTLTTSSGGRFSWPVAAVRYSGRDDAFLKAVATMNPAVSTDGSYVIMNTAGDCVIYVDTDQVYIARGLSDGTFAVRKIDEKTGIVGRPTKITIKNGAADFNRGIYWLTKTK